MARIAGVDLPREKRVEIGLTYIYGIGVASSNRILAEAKVDPNIRCKDLTDDDHPNERRVPGTHPNHGHHRHLRPRRH